jgi:hypothetical protein
VLLLPQQEPTTFDASGRPLLKFGRMLVGRSAQLGIALRNNGQLPASGRMEAEPHPAFTVTDGSLAPFTVQPGRGAAYTVQFKPLVSASHCLYTTGYMNTDCSHQSLCAVLQMAHRLAGHILVL